MGLGSATVPDPERLSNEVVRGLRAAGLRAGVPAVPVPIQFDEGFWANRLVSLGVSPGVVPLRGLRAARLASALVRVTREPSYRRRAEDLAGRIRAEDGVGPVAAALGRLTGGTP